jgi:hypothetical protein
MFVCPLLRRKNILARPKSPRIESIMIQATCLIIAFIANIAAFPLAEFSSEMTCDEFFCIYTTCSGNACVIKTCTIGLPSTCVVRTEIIQ